MKKKIVYYMFVGALIFTIGYNVNTIYKGYNKSKAVEYSEAPQIKNHQLTFDDKVDLYSQIELLNNKLNKCGTMQILTGAMDSEYIYDSHSEEVMSTENSNMLTVLHKLLYQQRIDISAKYKYNVKYDLSNIDIRKNGENITFYLREDCIKIEDIQEIDDTISIGEKYGWATKSFSDIEKETMKKFSRHKVNNYLIANNEVAVSAMDSIKENISNLCNSLGIENIDFFVYKNMTVNSDDKYQTVYNHSINNNAMIFN